MTARSEVVGLEPLHNIEPIVSPRWERWAATAIITAFALLAVAYSLGPLFEAQDEVSHYRLIRYVLNTRGLPGKVWDPASSNESGQAPLYYVVGAIIRSPLADSDFEPDYFQRDVKNPSWGYEKRVVNNDNKNVRFHAPSEEFPYQASQTALVAHVLRLYSVLIAIGTVTTCYAIFRILWPASPDRRLLALGVVAFWPHFIYVSGSITNDNLVYFTGSLSLFALLRLLRNGPSWRNTIGLGIALGLALLSKANAAFLAFPVGAAVIAERRLWKYAPVILAVTLMVSGWWYVRNEVLYGGFSGFESFWGHDTSFHIAPGEQTLAMWAGRMAVTYDYVWARFGLAEIPVADVIYRFFDLSLLVALAGFTVWVGRTARAALRREIPAARVVMVVVVVLFTLGWVAALGYVATVERWGVHARHYYPAMAGWGALFSVGFGALTPSRFRLRAALTYVSALAVIPVVCLFGFILPAYRVSPVPPQVEHPLSYTYADVAELIGIEQPDIHVQPGDRLYITIYWRALKPTDTALLAYLHTVGSDVVKRDSVSGTGNLPSTMWQPGQIWAERYYVVIPDDAAPQRTYPLIAGLQDPGKKKEPLPISGPAGPIESPVVGRVTVNGQPAPFEPDYRFGGVIGLARPTIQRSAARMTVCMDWLSLAATPTDYQAFVHVATPDHPLAAQQDAQPGAGTFPTSAWLPGEKVHECITLDASAVPQSGWKVLVGLYDLATGARLEAVDRGGQPLPDNAVVVMP